MRTLVVGDVHGCRDELVALLDLAGADRVVLVGDLFTKGPDPAGVWHEIAARGLEAVLGNHDDRLLRALDGRGKDVEASRCVARLDVADRRWRAWVQGLHLFTEAGPFTVVHAGLHPSGLLGRTTRRMALNLRRFPRELPGDPLWHAVYTGERRVVFGHDAVRGLVRVERGGLPWLVGLDTGCVYGGALSGYVVEEDRLLQVRARRAYRAV